jgi:carbonic anhydrase
MLSCPIRLVPVLLALLISHAVAAAEWDVVVRDRARMVELDRGSVLPSDPGTKVAWARIVLNPEERLASGYASVKALNRYDCNARSFHTIKRVYLDAEHNVIRDERVADPRPIPVDAGSVDERLWREVCKPPSSMDLKKLAEEAGKAAAGATAPQPPAATPPAAAPMAKAPAPASPAGAEGKGMRRADFHPAAKTEQADLTQSTEAPPPHPAPEPPAAPAREMAKPIAPLIQLPQRPAATPPPKPEPPVAAAPPVKAMALAAKPRPAAVPRVSEPERLALMKKSPEHPQAGVEVHRAMHWSYEGEAGPENWGRMNPEWSACAKGQRQSPIDIRDGIRVDQEPLRLDYKLSRFKIVDNGHTVQVTPEDGNTLVVMGRRFELVQFHFHRPSEERVDGRAFDMVAHLVHRDQDGRLGVVAVLMEVGEGANPLVQTLWNNLPLERHTESGPPEAIDLRQLLPSSGAYSTYMGSLTTPPCTEDVLWMVMRQPLQISDDQLRVFARLYPRNIRPIQRLNDRLIKESR